MSATANRPLWYRDAIIYELRVRAFNDSNADGIGDFPGLTAKLDYLQDLGVDTLWLLPFYPSPLKDDGYDISDYLAVHPETGTLQDFKHFVRQAHRRGLRVVTELVLNHTSDQHPWFQRARRAPTGSSHRDFYVWSDDPARYPEARIIFKDFESSNWAWDPLAGAYYWHRFYSHQPDLNYDHPPVRKSMMQVVDFWFNLGVDGVRIDAVPYLFERPDTNCENLPETHAFLKTLRRHVDQKFPNRMLLAEANQWPEDAAAYFGTGTGDECHMAFHFPIMPRLFMALHMEDRYPIVDILTQTPPIPETAQWALFLRNHDELTLEMVTDEERDYMYRVYAHDPRARINLGIRRRLAPLLGNNRRRIELMNGLLFSLPGTPIIYYGDEIGMGDNMYLGDRNGVRTPMQWSPDRNAGFSRANPQQLYLPVIIDPEYHYETVNVEGQQANPHSLLWWMRRLITLRERDRVFGRGTLEFLQPRNWKVLAFIRRFEDKRILVVANLSRFAQYVELDLAAFQGMYAVELLGGTRFPRIGELPYLITLGPHAFYWFELVSAPEPATTPVAPEQLANLEVAGPWHRVLGEDDSDALSAELPAFLLGRRWFGGKARVVKSVKVTDAVRLPMGEQDAYLTVAGVEYGDGQPESYMLPVMFGVAPDGGAPPAGAIARLTVHTDGAGQSGFLYDAAGERAVARTLLDAIARRRRFRGTSGTLVASRTRTPGLDAEALDHLEPRVVSAEQSNTSIICGDRYILKLFRRAEREVNPDLEIGRFLTERAHFPHTPPVVGSVEYRPAGAGGPVTVAVLHRFVPNEGNAWRFVVDEVERYFERALIHHRETPTVPLPGQPLVELTEAPPPPLVTELLGASLESARLLGVRTAELHLALASDPDDPAFAPEPFSALYQRGLYQSMRNLLGHTLRLLDATMAQLPKEAAADGARVRGAEQKILKTFRSLVGRKISASRIRCHGDYHLGQVLYTGKDFVIIDFEGEPARPVSERRIKRSPLRDVAGMLRSFHYAVYSVFQTRVAAAMARPDELAGLEPWCRFWHAWVSSSFLKAYLRTAGKTPFLPRSRDEMALMLDVYLLEKAVYELGYELNNRPTWAGVPLRGILQLVDTA